jgi:hypothetical protein
MTNTHENGFEPARFLVENVELLPKGRALDLAMGNGRNAIYLAKIGFKVEGGQNYQICRNQVYSPFHIELSSFRLKH